MNRANYRGVDGALTEEKSKKENEVKYINSNEFDMFAENVEIKDVS